MPLMYKTVHYMELEERLGLAENVRILSTRNQQDGKCIILYCYVAEESNSKAEPALDTQG